MPADLRTRIGHLDLPSPILTASGCAGSGRELSQFTDVAKIGAVITKSVTLEPKAGNPSPRMAETPSGLLSSVGLQGPGLDGFLQRDLPWLLSRGARAFVSIAGHTPREYGEVASRLSDSAGVTALEVNLGCPDAAAAVRARPGGGGVRRRHRAGQRPLRHPGLRQVVARGHRHRVGRPRVRGGGRDIGSGWSRPEAACRRLYAVSGLALVRLFS